jgi:TfoX/Sxy family transcriptional regulator of competence genes
MSVAADELAARIRAMIGLLPNVTERKMFGGLAFMLDGNMVVGVLKDGGLLARVGKEGYAEALTHPGAEPMTFTGREMSGFIVLRDDGIETDEALEEWIERARRFVATLPPK